MKKEFYVNIIILVAINAIVKPFYLLVVEVNVQNILGGNTWGYYFELLSFVYLFQFINDPGILQYNTVNLAKTDDKTNVEYILGLKIILAGLFLSCIIISHLVLGDRSFGMLFLISLNFILASLFILMRSSISATGAYRTDSIISSMDKIILLVLLVVILWGINLKDTFTIWWFISCQVFSSFAALVIAFFIFSKKLGSVKIRISKKRFRKILKSCLPYTILIFLMTAYTKMDGVMIGRLLPEGSGEAGIYGAGFRFFDAANMVGVLAAGILLPMYAKNIQNPKTLYQLLRSGTLALSLLIGSGVIILLLFSTPILSYFYVEYTPYYDEVFKYIILALLPLIVVHVFGPILLALRALRNINKIFFIAVIINFGLNYVLIPSQAAKGAAMATLITQVIVAVCLIPVTLLEIRKYTISKV